MSEEEVYTVRARAGKVKSVHRSRASAGAQIGKDASCIPCYRKKSDEPAVEKPLYLRCKLCVPHLRWTDENFTDSKDACAEFIATGQ